MAHFRVDTQDDIGLRLRSAPDAGKKNVLVTLVEGQLVEKLEEINPLWWRVRVSEGSTEVEGFAAARFLVPAGEFSSMDLVEGVQAVHLREGRPEVRRQEENYRAYPLGEPGKPTRSGSTPSQLATSLRRIIDFLDVERMPRYSPTTTLTYCNVYAHDFCYLAGVYLPRVWWTRTALTRLTQGDMVTPLYGATVVELNANALMNWLVEFGAQFGWRRTLDLDELQASANQGQVCVMVAQRIDLNRSGHIVAVAPEGPEAAKRINGRVTLPLQSQAGTKNRKLGTGTDAWWQRTETYRSFGYFVHP